MSERVSACVFLVGFNCKPKRTSASACPLLVCFSTTVWISMIELTFARVILQGMYQESCSTSLGSTSCMSNQAKSEGVQVKVLARVPCIRALKAGQGCRLPCMNFVC